MTKATECYVIVRKSDGLAVAETTSRKAADEYSKTGFYRSMPMGQYCAQRAGDMT